VKINNVLTVEKLAETSARAFGSGNGTCFGLDATSGEFLISLDLLYN
jgi:hypothetical protein